MYDALADYLTSFSRSYPVPWALLVMVGIAATSLVLYAFWEVVLRTLFAAIRKGGHH